MLRYFGKLSLSLSHIFNSRINLLKYRQMATNNDGAKINGKAFNRCTDIVWMDMEMTGLNVREDNVIEVSCLITDKEMNIISEGPSIAIHHEPEVFQKMNAWCRKHHNESGLVEKCLKSEISLKDAESLLLEYLKQHIPKGECPLAGNTVYMDRLFLREHMPRVDDYLHYRIIDVSTVKELVARWFPQVTEAAPKKKFVHRSLDDIKESINELLYYRKTIFRDINRSDTSST